jgi:putative ATPase
VLAGVKDIRDAVDQRPAAAAASGQGTHRLRRRGAPLQQGPAGRVPAPCGIGLFTFIGATTENPSFEVNSALLSRATVHVLQGAG